MNFYFKTNEKQRAKTQFYEKLFSYDEFKTIMEASDFWDKHDITDYWDDTKEVKFRSSLKKEPKYVALEESIAKKALAAAKKKAMSL